MARVIHALDVDANTGTIYPEPFRSRIAGRAKRKLGDAVGLKNFGVNLTTLAPGAASALRHWHSHQDELVYVVEGELTLITESGEQVLTAGMVAGFPGGDPDAHQLVNRGDEAASYLEIGDRSPDTTVYPDDDIAAEMVDGKWVFYSKDGRPYG